MPRVSVVIPTYNRCALVQAAVASVLRQDYRDFEVIVVDDGSTDGTEAAFAAAHPQVRYVRQPNRGVNAARNLGLSVAQGEFIALLDNDDLWLPFKLGLQVALLDRFPEIGFTFSEFNIITGEHTSKRQGMRTWHRVQYEWTKHCRGAHTLSELFPEYIANDAKIYVADVYEASLFEPFVLPTTAVFRRSAINLSSPFPEDDPICGDWEFFAKLSKQSQSLFVDLETANNRSHEDQVRLTRTKASIQLSKRLKMIERTWRADEEFMARRSAEVHSVQRDLLLRLAKLQLLESNNVAARDNLKRARELTPQSDASLLLWSLLATLTGSGAVLRGMRWFRDKAIHRTSV